MTPEVARKLRPGHKVVQGMGKARCTGTVVHMGLSGITILWDDGVTTVDSPNAMLDVDRWTEAYPLSPLFPT